MAVGFYWSANSAYIKPMWLRVRRVGAMVTPGLSDGNKAIPLGGTPFVNANPAYIIYECLTNTEWGMGDPYDSVDTASFEYAGAVLKAESFGLFMTWVRQSTIEDFVREVLDHIQATLFLHPATGLWTLRLLRADYEVNALPLYNPDNADMSDFDRKTWGETINEIVVTWTNPVNEQTETVSIQDLANIVQQGGQIVSQGRNYYGIRSATLALAVASRDLRSAVAPLASCTLKAFRKAWSAVPGDCVRLNWPEEGVEDDIVMRVQQVDYGSRSDGYVTVVLLEDIFSRDAPVYVGAPSTDWQSTARPPNPFADMKVFTAPAFIIANPNPALAESLEYPEVITGLLLSDPNPDIQGVEPFTATTLATGDVVQQSIGTRNRVGHTLTTAAWPAEAMTTIVSFGAVDGPLPRLASLVFIGSGGDEGTEIALVQQVAADGTYTLARGVLDTVPRPWPSGTPLFFLATESVLDPTPRSPGETVTYTPLMRTSVGLLPFDSGVAITTTLSARPYLPLRPANVQVNGQGFGTVALGGEAANVSWSNRNRLTETSQILDWTAGSVAGEAGQTTRVEVLGSGGSVIKSFAGLTGSSFTVSTADMQGAAAVRVVSTSGYGDSLQAFTLAVTP